VCLARHIAELQIHHTAIVDFEAKEHSHEHVRLASSWQKNVFSTLDP
jgi:hypothetical protein